jgi:HSP20 family protein
MMRSPFFSDFVALRDTLDRVVDEAVGASPFQNLWARPNGTVAQAMPIDVYATEDHAVILAAVPGMRPDDLEVSVHRNTVSLGGKIGNVAESTEAKGATWYVHELGNGTYRRSVTLPFPIDADRIEATLDNGIVRIVVPKSEQAKPRRIAIASPDQQQAIGAGATAEAESKK